MNALVYATKGADSMRTATIGTDKQALSVKERNRIVEDYLWRIDCVIRQNYALLRAAHLDMNDV